MTETYKGYTITIERDDYPENPIENWDMLGTFSCFHRRYSMGNDKQHRTPEDLENFFRSTPVIKLPIYMYDHSGVTIRTEPFSCPWDSGKLGYIWVTKEKARKEYGRLTKKTVDKILSVLRNEVDTYDKYISGEVYWYKVEDQNEELVYSCGGYFEEEEYVLQQAKEVVEADIKIELKKEKECAAIMAI